MFYIKNQIFNKNNFYKKRVFTIFITFFKFKSQKIQLAKKSPYKNAKIEVILFWRIEKWTFL